MPFGKGKRIAASAPRAVDHVIGGWTLNGIYSFMSGEPFSVRSGVRTANYSHETRADIVGSKPETKLSGKPGVIGPVYFANSLSSFAIPAPGATGAGRNIFEAAGYWNMDFGLTKLFAVTERVKLQLRTEFFNVFNHANSDNPRDSSNGSASFRSTVFAQTCCATVAPPTTQTIIQTGESARVIQFALKLSF